MAAPMSARPSVSLLERLVPAVPAARIAVMRRLIAAFVIIDVLVFRSDVLARGGAAESYRPMLLARLLHLPPISTTGAWCLLIAILVPAALGVLGIRPRLTGALMGAGFWLWMLWSTGYGYVSHDHLALMIAVLALPFGGRASTSASDAESLSERAGWSVRWIQLAVVATYLLSVASKWIIAGSIPAWANGAIIAFALVRRGAPWAMWLLQVPVLLVPAQWGLVALELASPLALVLRGRAKAALITAFLLFHLTTFVALGIHFLPTVVCWAAFCPLERWIPRRRGRGSSTAPLGPQSGQCPGEADRARA